MRGTHHLLFTEEFLEYLNEKMILWLIVSESVHLNTQPWSSETKTSNYCTTHKSPYVFNGVYIPSTPG